MKFPFALLMIGLALSVGACGKKDDSATVVNGGAIVAPAPVDPGYPAPPWNSGMTIQQYCQLNYGQYSGTSCTFNYGSRWNAQIGAVTTGIYVNFGNRVNVASSGNPKILVGGMTMGYGNASFVSSASGYLGFQKYSFSTYSISSIQITVCSDGAYQVLPCP